MGSHGEWARKAALFFACLALVVMPISAGSPTPQSLGGGEFPWKTVYVDDDAPGDPGPNDPAMSDPLEDGSAAHPFDTINEAIHSAADFIDIRIAAGDYAEDLDFLPSVCAMSGAGVSETRLRPISSSAIRSSRRTSTSTFLAVSGMTLDEVGLWARDSGSMIAERLDIRAATLDVYSRDDVTLRSLTIESGFVSLATYGPEIHALMEGSTLSGTGMAIGSCCGLIDATLRGVVAPDTEIQLKPIAADSPIRLSITDATLAGISSTYLNASTYLRAERVHFTGPGLTLDTREGIHTLEVWNSVFDQGGVTIHHQFDGDQNGPEAVRLGGNVFHHEGIRLTKDNGYDYSFDVEWWIGANLFLEHGVAAHIGARRTPYPGLVSTRIVNNVFRGGQDGVALSFTTSSYFPEWEPDRINTAVMNNTFVQVDNALQVTVASPQIGNTPLRARLLNNVVYGGETGVDADSREDLALVLAGNDVYGAALANYSGGIMDPTGRDGNISEDPGFEDLANGDFRLRTGSPCIDAGVLDPELPEADALESLRVLDGDGDGTALPDIGAFEFSPVDADGDGYPWEVDCNDADPLIHPAAVDLPGNTIDEDCDGTLVCDPAAAWRSTSQFVSCVAESCNTLVLTGLVDPLVCNDLVSRAGSSGATGRKPRMDRTESIDQP